MNSLQWGKVFPDLFYKEENEFIFIFNHDLSDQIKVDRTIRFVIGKLLYYDTQLPRNPKHILKFDVRGQRLEDRTLEFIEDSIFSKYSRPHFLKVEFIKF